MYEIDEETNEMKYTEDFIMPATSELSALDKWCNLNPTILKVGRTTHVDTEAPEEWDDEKKEAFAKMLEDDKQDEAPFRAISEHAPLKGADCCWLIKVVGDT